MKLPIVILDTETTGLDVLRAVPIEVGLVLVELEGAALVERASFRTLLPAPPAATWELGALDMHRRSGLLLELDVLTPERVLGLPRGAAVHPLEMEAAQHLVEARLAAARVDAARRACAWIDSAARPASARGEVVACGANVGRFDLTILRRTMPELAARFFYRTLDVSAIKVAASMLGWADEPERPKTHRALDDCRATLADLNHYHALLRRGGYCSA